MAQEFEECLANLTSSVRIVRGEPPKKKRGSKSSSPVRLPKYFLRVGANSNSELVISVCDLKRMYRKQLDHETFQEHLSDSGFQNCSWTRFFEILNTALDDNTLSVTKGKGHGFVYLNIQYPVSSAISLNGQMDLELVDEFVEDDVFREDQIFELFQESMAVGNRVHAPVERKHSPQPPPVKHDDLDMKSEILDLRIEVSSLRSRIADLEAENTRLKTIDSIGDIVQLGDALKDDDVAMTVPAATTSHARKRKKGRSLINPRRKKRRKAGFDFGGEEE